jgi:hypothetical protein
MLMVPGRRILGSNLSHEGLDSQKGSEFAGEIPRLLGGTQSEGQPGGRRDWLDGDCISNTRTNNQKCKNGR